MVLERFFRAFALSTFLFALTGLVCAQGTTSRITGIVNDASGAAVVGATVTINREGTGTFLTAQTSSDSATSSSDSRKTLRIRTASFLPRGAFCALTQRGNQYKIALLNMYWDR